MHDQPEYVALHQEKLKCIRECYDMGSLYFWQQRTFLDVEIFYHANSILVDVFT
jgi:hypothetical protein